MTRFTHCKLLLSRNNSLTLAPAKAHTPTEKKQITRYRLAKIKSPLPSVASKAETPERLAIHALGLSHCRAAPWKKCGWRSGDPGSDTGREAVVRYP